MPSPSYTPTPAELATLRAALDADPSIHARLLRSGEAGLEAGGWDGRTLSRWLAAEGGDVKAAAGRLAGHAAWRAGLLPDGWTAEKGVGLGGGGGKLHQSQIVLVSYICCMAYAFTGCW